MQKLLLEKDYLQKRQVWYLKVSKILLLNLRRFR